MVGGGCIGQLPGQVSFFFIDRKREDRSSNLSIFLLLQKNKNKAGPRTNPIDVLSARLRVQLKTDI